MKNKVKKIIIILLIIALFVIIINLRKVIIINTLDKNIEFTNYSVEEYRIYDNDSTYRMQKRLNNNYYSEFVQTSILQKNTEYYNTEEQSLISTEEMSDSKYNTKILQTDRLKMFDLKSIIFNVKKIRKEICNGRECYLFEIKNDENMDRIWIDKETGILVREISGMYNYTILDYKFELNTVTIQDVLDTAKNIN